MKRRPETLGLVLVFCLGPAARAGDRPVNPDLKKYQEFARQVQELVRDNKAEEFARCFDEDVLIQRTLNSLQLPDDLRKDIEKGLRGKRGASGDLAGQICKVSQQAGSSYTLLHVRRVNGQPCALFRLLNDGKLNYNDLFLAAEASGKVRVVDVYVALSGELVSESMRRMVRLGLSGTPKQADQLRPDNDFLKHLAPIQRLAADARSGRFREGLKEWAELPPRVREEKMVALMRVLCAQGLYEEDEKGYIQAMEDFRKAFPNDPAVDLVSIDHLFLKKRFCAYQRALDRIERALGRDPYLDVMRANGFVAEGRIEEANRVARRAIKDESDLIQAHWILLTIVLRNRDHKETLRLLTDIQKRFHVEFDDLTRHEQCKDFVKSQEYKEWLKRQKK